MIDLTPLDVRKKKEDFKRAVRGYDPLQVDSFLDLVADRLEQLVREHGSLSDRVQGLEGQLKSYQERERALNEALLAAQELREEARSQSERDAAVRLREAETHAEAILLDADQAIRHSQRRLEDLKLRRGQFLKSLSAMLERFEDYLELESSRLEADPDDLGELLERLQSDLVEPPPTARGAAASPSSHPVADTAEAAGPVDVDLAAPAEGAGQAGARGTEAALNGDAPAGSETPVAAETPSGPDTEPGPSQPLTTPGAASRIAPGSITPADAGGSGTASS